ncbi:MAG: hypothetical protein KJZ93_13260 [Caldilineaceae bacterium]|nr:hypothetical protein [Caldilineaceae bacterium]
MDSEAACSDFLHRLLTAVYELREKYPERELALSLSGGRQTMAALTLLAAQRCGIDRIFHTLITDIDLETRIETETSLSQLIRLSAEERTRRLFLNAYDRSQFQLFAIPMIAVG